MTGASSYYLWVNDLTTGATQVINQPQLRRPRTRRSRRWPRAIPTAPGSRPRTSWAAGRGARPKDLPSPRRPRQPSPWNNPADIVYGTPLGDTQLNASASVAGTFAYSPAAGTVLNAGNGQMLSVVFTPTDAADYTTASAAVTINVSKATPVITWAQPADIVYGTDLGDGQLNAMASVDGSSPIIRDWTRA